MAFAEKPIDNSPQLHLLSETPLGDKSEIAPIILPSKPERPTAPPGTIERLEQEYRIADQKGETERLVELMRLRNTANNYPITIRRNFFRSHPDVEFLSRR